MTGRMIDRDWVGPKAAAFYVANGLRVLPLHPDTKAAARKGFGLKFPDFCAPPQTFRANELIAILFGECPLGDFAGGRRLCGLDLDAPFDRTALEPFVGPLPHTLSSKNGRHLYFWITPEQHAKGELSQGNDVLRTKASGRGALDLRPAAGGYFLERGDWDPPLGFDRCAIRDLPDAAHATLLAARSAKAGRPVAACPLTVNAFEGDEVSPLNALGEPVLNDLARELARLWPAPGQGGGHDLALALGGILADAYGSLDDVCDFASRVHYYAQAPDATEEVVSSVLRRRSGISGGIYGWPTLKRMLLAAQAARSDGGIPELAIQRTLNRLKNEIPGLDTAKLKTEQRAQKVAGLVKAFNDADQPRARALGLKEAFALWMKAQKRNAPGADDPGAFPSTNLSTKEEQL